MSLARRFPILFLAFGLAVAMGLNGCADRGQVLAPDGAGFSVASLDDVARAFALGMAAPEIRAVVRDAMRASRLTEHKLSLQEFAASAEAEPLLRAAAQVSGTAVADLRATIATLPDLDFYVPSREQRLTWRATGDYVVAVSLHGRAPTIGYDAVGGAVTLDLTRPESPARVVLMLQSAETKSPRINAQADGPGLTIQDPNDGELSGSMVRTDPSGKTRTIYLADLVEPGVAIARDHCPPEVIYCEHEEDPPPSPPSTATYLDGLLTQAFYDNNNYTETSEVEFRAMTPDGSTNAIRIEGVPVNGFTAVNAVLLYVLPPMWVGGEGGSIAVRETDAWPNPDDFFYHRWGPGAGQCGAFQLPASQAGYSPWYTAYDGGCVIGSTFIQVRFRYTQ